MMNDLTDLEICKRIAEIENIAFTVENPLFGVEHLQPVNHVDAIYDPLTDDALCFQLMVKYQIEFNIAKFTDDTINRYEANDCDTAKRWGFSKNPNKAICLAIIEAHGDK